MVFRRKKNNRNSNFELKNLNHSHNRMSLQDSGCESAVQESSVGVGPVKLVSRARSLDRANNRANANNAKNENAR